MQIEKKTQEAVRICNKELYNRLGYFLVNNNVMKYQTTPSYTVTFTSSA